MDISVIIPVLNEGENILPLHSELKEVLDSISKSYEIIFINDGSNDNTLENLKRAHNANPNVKIINFAKNFGQTAAITAGFNNAEGDIIITMDGDLQNDPHDIPRLLEEINKGFDIISGWRKRRKDFFLRVFISRAANFLISKLLGLKLRDYGCTLKVFRKEIVKQINLYGEMHRFIPAVASWSGVRVGEIAVNHRYRKAGKTKYGYDRIMKVFLDLLTMIFLSEYRTKPIRFFGGLAMWSFLLGAFSFVALCYMKIAKNIDITGNPLMILTALFFLVGFQFISIGFIAEINIRTYYESQKKTIYHIKDVIR
jgi:glycosyltransferase involved in cell wall biosynthesis